MKLKNRGYILLILLWIVGFGLNAQILHDNTCSSISTNFTLDWDSSPSATQFNWTPQGGTSFTASNIQGSGNQIGFVVSGATGTLTTENSISTPGITNSLSGGADALHISSSGLSSTEELTVTMTFTPALAGDISFDIYNVIELSGGGAGGQQIEVFGLTTTGFALIPELTDNGTPSWELEGPGVIDGNATSTTTTNDQVGVNFRSITDISTITVTMRRCSGCGNAANTEFAIGDIDICLTPDTDQDGIADSEDEDDDNDGIWDVREKCPASARSIADWDNMTYTNGDASNTYALEDGTNMTVAVASNGASIVAGETSTFITGGQGGGTVGLFINGNQNLQVNSIDISFSWDQAIDSLEYTIFDVDQISTQWVDSVTIIGYYNGFVVFPTMTGSANNTVTTNRAVGDANTIESSAIANVDVAFTEPIDSMIIFYGNGNSAPAAPGNQWISIYDLSYIGDCGSTDSDGDGISDYLDIDADNDGIVDYIEWQGSTGTPIAPAGADADMDGIDDNFETAILPIDTDGDGIPDFKDLDSDDDGDLDALEAYDTNNDGTANTLPSGTDTDGDGLDDNYDNQAGFNATTNITNNGQDSDDFPNLDGETTERDWREDTDIDNDGVQDYADIDDDNDGILDVNEGKGTNNPVGDEDGDGIPNFADVTDGGNGGDGSTTNYTDGNADGIPDVFDADNDGIPNHHDPDSDGDGIADIIEAGGVDADGNGIVDGVFADTDGDGWSNTFDATDGGTALTDVDQDGDGLQNHTDIDSDDDGIIDLIESQASTATPIIPSGTDSDGDGIDNNFDTDSGNNLTDPVNTDAVDNDDYLDTNSDNDVDSDQIEGYDTNNDGSANTSPSGTDTDNDGLDDNFDNIAGQNSTTNVTNNGQDSEDFPDLDTPGGEQDWRDVNNTNDNDGDGVTNDIDIDDDNDGILDTDEGCPSAIPSSTIQVDIDLDAFEDETTWTLVDPQGTTVLSGGAYLGGDDIISVSTTTTLAGRWVFTINDSFGDGLVENGGSDENGTSSYTLTVDGVVSYTSGNSPNYGGGESQNIDVGLSGITYTGTVTSQTGVTNSANITGTPNSNSVTNNNAEWLTNGNILVFDFGSIQAAGTRYVITWSEVTGQTGTASLIIEESTDNAAYTTHTSAPTTNTTTSVTDVVTSENSFRYLRISKNNPPSTTDFKIDGIGLAPSLVCIDTDNDGIQDSYDPDSDGDGIADIVEAGGVDADGNGIVDGAFTDTDGDGWSNTFDATDGGTALTDADTDADGFENRIDIDSDGDGIVDIIESQASGTLISPSGSDADGDGIDDNFDVNSGNTLTVVVNTDGTDNPDYTDTDSDNDGDLDALEGWDTDNDGTANTVAAGSDTDNDGLDNNFDNIVGPNTTTNITNNGQTSASFPNLDKTATPELDWREGQDNDNDGIIDEIDIDDDNDGILDIDEGCNNPHGLLRDTLDWDNETWSGTSGTYVLNNVTIGINAVWSGTTGTVSRSNTEQGGFGGEFALMTDINPAANTDSIAFSFDFNRTIDTLRFIVWDIDDRTGDTPDFLRVVGYLNGVQVLPTSVTGSASNTVVGNTVEGDVVANATTSDGNATIVFESDIDSLKITQTYGAGAAANPQQTRWSIHDMQIAIAEVAAIVCTDTDNDGVIDSFDPDSDGDGIADIIEAGGVDADGNGVVDGAFTDTDGDGWSNTFDASDGGTALADTDTDTDGFEDRIDIDSDGDGIIDIIESQASGTLIAPSGTDTDGDGIDDNFDTDESNSLTTPVNTDGTDNPDYTDTNSDNDGEDDIIEAYDTDDNGSTNTIASGSDTDNDGLDDSFDNIVGPNAITNVTNSNQSSNSFPNQDNGNTAELDWREINDADGDGIADEFDIDDDNDGILDTEECGSVLEDGGFEAITGLTVNSNNLGEDISPWVTADPTNVIEVDGNGGASYGIGGPEYDARGLAGNYYDINGSGDIYQSFTLSNAATVSYGGYFSARDGGTGNGDITIHTGVGDGGAVQSTTGTLTTSDNDDWSYTSNSISLPAGTYSFVVNMDNPLNFDEGIIALTCDTDGDGVDNRIDLDSDNDGIVDIIEAGGVDANNDGRVDGAFSDADGDGWATTFDNVGEAGTPLAVTDTDGDGVENYLDLDSDNDGIVDNVEGQTTGAFASPQNTDTDDDGWDDRYDSDNGGTAITLSNVDGGDPDYIDIDSDGDTFNDWLEGFDDNNSEDALDDLIARATAYEAAAGNPMKYVNSDDSDADDIPNWLEDTDGDGTPNFLDPDNALYEDTDNDGLVDLYDTDISGVVSNTPDLDGDGEYDFRDTDNEISLPVELIEFSALKLTDKVALSWKTATEVNNDYFIIERSIDGRVFKTILKQDGNGNSTKEINYLQYDESPVEGLNYYRLTQFDFDGKNKVYNQLIRVVKFEGKGGINAKLYPNPTRGLLYLELKKAEVGRYRLEIFSSKGEKLKVDTFVISHENPVFKRELLNGLTLTKGVYYVKVQGEKIAETFKFIVQ